MYNHLVFPTSESPLSGDARAGYTGFLGRDPPSWLLYYGIVYYFLPPCSAGQTMTPPLRSYVHTISGKPEDPKGTYAIFRGRGTPSLRRKGNFCAKWSKTFFQAWMNWSWALRPRPIAHVFSKMVGLKSTSPCVKRRTVRERQSSTPRRGRFRPPILDQPTHVLPRPRSRGWSREGNGPGSLIRPSRRSRGMPIQLHAQQYLRTDRNNVGNPLPSLG